MAAVEELDFFAQQSLAQEDAGESLVLTHQVHARAVRVGQTQHSGSDAIDLVIELEILFGCELMNAIDIYGDDRMLLIHRQILRLAINLARAGQNQFRLWIM